MILRKWPWLILVLISAGAVLAVFPEVFQARLETAAASRAEQGLFIKVDQLINQNRFPEAEKLLERWLTRHPQADELRPQVLWRLSQIKYHLAKNEAGGLEVIALLAAEHPQAPEAVAAREFILARQESRPETYAEAAQGYSLLVSRFPGHARVPEWRLKEARLRLKTEDFLEAEAALNSIINGYPSWPELDKVYDELAQVHLVLGRPEEAVRILTALIENWPDSQLRPKARADLARSLESQGDYRAAREIYRELTAEYPENPGYKRRLDLLEARIKGENQNAGQVDYNYRPPRSVNGEPH